jgi:hypothetical protein
MPARRQCAGSHAAGSATLTPCRYYHTQFLGDWRWLRWGGIISVLVVGKACP